MSESDTTDPSPFDRLAQVDPWDSLVLSLSLGVRTRGFSAAGRHVTLIPRELHVPCGTENNRMVEKLTKKHNSLYSFTKGDANIHLTRPSS